MNHNWRHHCEFMVNSAHPGSSVPGILQARTLEIYRYTVTNKSVCRYVYVYALVHTYISPFLMAHQVKNLPVMQETQKIRVQFLSWEDPLKEGMATHSSILAWRIPMDRRALQARSIGSQRVEHNWSEWTHKHACNLWEPRGQYLRVFYFAFSFTDSIHFQSYLGHYTFLPVQWDWFISL